VPCEIVLRARKKGYQQLKKGKEILESKGLRVYRVILRESPVGDNE